MAGLQFHDRHNAVAFLEVPRGCEDFTEIVEFLRATPIKYALTVNPTIYVSYIKQFWSTAKIKIINGKTQIHAKVARKQIIITESSVRRDLQFNDKDGIDYLPNNVIFENLELMGYERLSEKLTLYKPFFSPQWKYLIQTILQCLSSKSTTWNEFGTKIASAVICLAKNQKFNFSKLIFDGMLRNLDSSNKFLMYPRFLQLFLNNQIENLSELKDVYETPSHTKKIFANMRRQGKDFSGAITPLFETMLSQRAEVGEGLGQPAEPQPRSDEDIIEVGEGSRQPAEPQPRSDEDRIELKELMEIYTKLSERVLAQALEISRLEKRVKKLEKKRKSRTQCFKRLLKVGTSRRVGSKHARISLGEEDASKQARISSTNTQEFNDGTEVIEEDQEGATEHVSGEPLVEDKESAEKEVRAADDVTLAETLIELRSLRPRAKGVVIGGRKSTRNKTSTSNLVF